MDTKAKKHDFIHIKRTKPDHMEKKEGGNKEV